MSTTLNSDSQQLVDAWQLACIVLAGILVVGFVWRWMCGHVERRAELARLRRLAVRRDRYKDLS